MRAVPAAGISSTDSNIRFIGAAAYRDSSARKCAASPGRLAGASGGIAVVVAGKEREQGVARPPRRGAWPPSCGRAAPGKHGRAPSDARRRHRQGTGARTPDRPAARRAHPAEPRASAVPSRRRSARAPEAGRGEWRCRRRRRSCRAARARPGYRSPLQRAGPMPAPPTCPSCWNSALRPLTVSRSATAAGTRRSARSVMSWSLVGP